MKQLFRREALERLSSPERLDRPVPIARPMSWLPLGTVALLLGIAGIWSLFGRIPIAVTGNGILLDVPRSGRRVGVAYFANGDGKQIQPGATARIIPSSVKPRRYGGILGTVTEVSPFPVTVDAIATAVNNPDLAASLAATTDRDGIRAPIQIGFEFESDPDIPDGHRRSSGKSTSPPISAGTTVKVRVTTARVRPIAYLIPLPRSRN